VCGLFDKFVKDRSDRAISEMRLSGVFPSQLKQVLKRSDLEEQHAPAVIKRPYSLIYENRNNKEADSFVKKKSKDSPLCQNHTLELCSAIRGDNEDIAWIFLFRENGALTDEQKSCWIINS